VAQSGRDISPDTGLSIGELPHPEEGVKARTPRQIFWGRFKEDKLAIFGAILVAVMILMAISAPFLSKYVVHHAVDQTFEHEMLDDFGTPLGPTQQFWFGADRLGRDLFVRVLYGAQVSLRIAFIATGIEVGLGVIFGMLAGMSKGWMDTIISRLIDLILSIPFLLLGISLSIAVGAGEGIVIALIAFFGWPYIARIVRGQTLSLREAQFVEAAHSLGASPRWVMFREILPNLMAPIIIYATLVIPTNIVVEATLTYLGVGVKEPTAAWGSMLEQSTNYTIYGEAWWYMFYPGMALFLTVLGFNLFGDGLRDALDPKTAK
jgi:ABC-type dipeptide/oligopeptide/nickel transport system permease subunit